MTQRSPDMTGPTSSKVMLKGHIDVPADKITIVTSALPEHIELTRAEPGCISFQVVPCTTVTGRFLVSEIFEDKAAFDAHQARTKASDWFMITQGIPRSYKITTGEP